MDKLQFYKELYYFEVERIDKLRNALSIPVGIATVLGGLVGFYLKGYRFSDMDFLTISFTILLLVSLFFLAVSTYFLIRSYYGYQYHYLPDALQIEKYFDSLFNYHKSKGGGLDAAEKEFYEFLVKRYTATTSANTWANDSRSQFLHKANRSLVLAIIFVLSCSIPFYVRSYTISKSAQKVLVGNAATPLEK